MPRHTDDVQREMKRRGPAGHGHRSGQREALGKLLLEEVEMGSDRRNPVRFERLEEQPAFFGPDVRR